MPTRPPTPCLHPGCPELVYERGGYCTEHKAGAIRDRRARYECHRVSDPARALAKKIRSTARWTRFSKLFKQNHPICCDPFKVHGEWPPLTAHAHHVTPLIEAPDRAFDESNLASLCTTCHRRVETMVNAGQKTDHLFPRVPEKTDWIGFA